MNAEQRASKVAQLSSSDDIMSKYSSEYLEANSEKVGVGLINIVLHPDYVQTNSTNPMNPGFHFGQNGSLVRHGRFLDLDGDFAQFFFKGGQQQFNPLGHRRASSTTDPLPLIVQSLRGLGEFAIGNSLKGLTKKLSTL